VSPSIVAEVTNPVANPIIETLKSQVMERVETLKNSPTMTELLKLHAALNNLEDVDGSPRTSISQLFGLDAIADGTSGLAAAVSVRPGQYFDKTPLDAAKDYLSRCKRAATLDDIMAALRTGSCDPGPRDKFGLSLARSTFNFVKLNDDLYDLLDRYPNVKEKRQPKRTKAARVEEIMSNQTISLNKAFAKAEEEEQEEHINENSA